MPVTLSSSDLARHREVSRLLLSPLSEPDPSVWAASVLSAMETLFRADRSILVAPAGDATLLSSESLPPEILSQFGAILGAQEPGVTRWRDPDLDASHQRRRSLGARVWSNAMLERLSGRPMRGTAVYHEVVEPAGVAHGSGMNVSLASGEAMICIAHSKPADDPFGVGPGMQLLETLLPAFEAGVRTIVGTHARRVGIAGMLDQFGDAVLVCGLDGATICRSTRLSELAAEDAEGEVLVAEMRAAALCAAAAARPDRGGERHEVGARLVRTATARYRLVPALVAEGIFGHAPAVLVRAERIGPRLPSAERLRERYGLTRREAEIAGWLSLGHSNREIGARLFLSAYTVRNHAERLYAKLGIHSRKALALRLMEEDPQ